MITRVVICASLVVAVLAAPNMGMDIVKNGKTTLMGFVGNEMDRRLAEIRAREVSGVFSVENELVVDGE